MERGRHLGSDSFPLGVEFQCGGATFPQQPRMWWKPWKGGGERIPGGEWSLWKGVKMEEKRGGGGKEVGEGGGEVSWSVGRAGGVPRGGVSM